MSDILKYFDSINIDVAKRKYYNVNKVNAVLEELRAQAAELVEENERQRMELEALRAERTQKQTDTMNSREMLLKLQRTYRETLEKAHYRADGIIQDAEAKSGALMQEAEEKKSLAASQIKACFLEMQNREEENIRILDSRLQRLLEALGARETDVRKVNVQAEPAPLSQKSGSIPPENSAWIKSIVQPVEEEEDEEERAGVDSRDQLKDLELQIRRLAKEISALESGI
ncbi:MAG: hypothetical protein IJ121_06870 [Eubacterium sp.]|nr:hypothetical protein [Eubacterium sp.]